MPSDEFAKTVISLATKIIYLIYTESRGDVDKSVVKFLESERKTISYHS